MPQCRYNSPLSVVFIKLNYINVGTAGGKSSPLTHLPPTFCPPDYSACGLNGPTNKTDKTSEIRKLTCCASGRSWDLSRSRRPGWGCSSARVGLGSTLDCLPFLGLSRQRLVKHQCVCPFGSVRSVPRPPRVLVSLTSRQRRNHELST